ncbi:MAG: cadherin repeat domain-containing protein, partial [Planctomycetaceae bacterium]|nr:cadherin repeat domain-containing protein [Planctomycetaceae bacterium]
MWIDLWERWRQQLVRTSATRRCRVNPRRGRRFSGLAGRWRVESLERRELLTNSPPIVDDQSFALPENSTNETIVGTVAASDADLDALSYAITSGNTNGAFAIDASTGLITVANPAMLNFEATPIFTLNVDVGDGIETDSAVVTINLSNVNEAPSIAPASRSINENLSLGVGLGLPFTSDPDADDTRTVSIVSGNTGGAFAINPSTGVVVVNNPAAIDFETTPTFMLGLRVTDAGGLTGDAIWTINLIDRNDIPTISSATFSLPENSPNGTVVGTIVANDQDAGDTKAFLLGQDNLSGVFAIDSAGVLTVANSSILNFEARTSITVHVQVTDSGQAWAVTTFTVNLSNVNDAPVVGSATITRNEHLPNGASIGVLSSSDQDANDSRTWAITGGNVDGAFAINPTTGLITVATSTAMNFEVTPTFVLTIQATDTGGLTGTGTLTINLANINEAPIVSAGTFSLPENSVNGTVVGTVPAVDPDAGAVVTYAITSAAPTGAFAVDAATGQITVANSALLNFETTPAPFFFVRATDQFGMSTTNRMTVNLSNVQEAPTVAPRTFSIAENSANFTTVGSYSATDPEGGSFTWSILSGNIGGAFALNVVTGAVIRVANSAALDFETTPTFSLVLQAVDSTGLRG